jgi:hypothetical protein
LNIGHILVILAGMFFLLKPSDYIAIFPLPISASVLCDGQLSFPMLLAIYPNAFKYFAICPSKEPIATPLVPRKLASIGIVGRPFHCSLTMHVILKPLPIVLLAINELLNPL